MSHLSFLSKKLPTFQVFGANTEVGKTIFSTALSLGILHNATPKPKVNYIKPVSTGDIVDADINHLQKYAPDVEKYCFFQYSSPVSPHLAVQKDNCEPPSEKEILKKIVFALRNQNLRSGTHEESWTLLETAGGVLSPGPTGCSQADMYRPLRLPTILVGDSKLGGISTTISAYESLKMRGYDINLLLLFQDTVYQNAKYLKEYFDSRSKVSPWKDSVPKVVSILPPPELSQTISYSEENDFKQMTEYYRAVSQSSEIKAAYEYLKFCHKKRINSLESMANDADKRIWYPFSQHSKISPKDILAIDSAHGDFFQTVTETSSTGEVIQPRFDSSASWWTQGLGHGNPELALTAGYAAGRYGHVIFAGTVHDPALRLAEKLVNMLDNKRLSRVFYSDNGSTGIEVALKMAFKATEKRYKLKTKTSNGEIGIIGLKKSYHGDTIGSMNACEESVYNKQVNWYQGKGYWFDFPQIKLCKGVWCLEVPDTLLKDGLNLPMFQHFSSLNEVFDLGRRNIEPYKQYILTILKREILEKERKFGAVLLEPLLLGAGGMNAVDPLFQKALVDVVRENPTLFGQEDTDSKFDLNSWQGLPIIFDEVFTGLYRLGHKSAAKLLQTEPDIVVNAKLLTGGVVPLCTTTSSNSIFEAFLSPEKVDGLLHGHSYTAHPVGCSVALQSLNELEYLSKNGSSSWKFSMDNWSSSANQIWSFWDKNFVEKISQYSKVQCVFAMGSVLAITLQDKSNGYSSNAADEFNNFISGLKSDEEIGLHVRGLGNVLYFMTSMKPDLESLRKVEDIITQYFE